LNLFDIIAPVYGSSLRLRQASRDDIISYLGLTSDSVVVDIGGGSGIGARSAVRVSGCRAVVIDRSAGMLRQSNSGDRLLPVMGDAMALPMADGSVDGALCLDALHHFRDVVAALREIRRVLRPGSHLVVQEMDRRRISARLISLAERVVGEPGSGWTPVEMADLLKASGLTPTDVVTRGRVYYAIASRPS
jgi:ubiquinone/menaquinone biosynthesis C-methylase UbiE